MSVSPIPATLFLIVDTTEDTVADDGKTSLREAIMQANEATGDTTIIFSNEIAGQTITLTQGELMITRSMTINGDGPEEVEGNVTVSGGLNGRVFSVDLESGEAVSLESLNVTDGLVSASDPDVPDGGAGVKFTGEGSLVLSDMIFSDNVVAGASGSGGAVFSAGGQLDVLNSTFQTNGAVRAGGAIEIFDTDIVEIEGVLFEGNGAGNGGAVHVTSGDSVAVVTSRFIENIALGEGGGFWNNEGTLLTITNSDFNSNSALGADADQGGGGLYNNGGNVVASDVFFDNNSAGGVSGSGGAIFSTDGNVVLEGAGFVDNSANRAGGAIEVIDGQLTLLFGSARGNTATGSSELPANPGNGGAVHTTGTATVNIQNFTFNGNEASNEGGALWFSAGTTAVSEDSIYHMNTAGTDGGGIFLRNGAHVDVRGGSFAANEAVNGQAVFTGGPAATGGGLHFGRGLDEFDEAVSILDQSVVGGTSEDTILGDGSQNFLFGGDSDDFLLPNGGGDKVTGGGGADLFIGTGEELDGTNILDLTAEDAIAVTQTWFSRSMLEVSNLNGVTLITTSGSGDDFAMILTGDFRGGNFLTGRFSDEGFGSGTGIAFLEHLPTLTEGVALASPVSPADQAAVELFLEGNTSFNIVIDEARAGAVFRNAVGVYEIDSEGNISNVRIIDTDASDGGEEFVFIGEDRQLGLFIIQDGAEFAEGLSAEDMLSFDASGNLLLNNLSTDEMVFHATRQDLNSDGRQHAVAGTDDSEANVLLLGFEDLTDLGDADYQDVFLRIEAREELLL